MKAILHITFELNCVKNTQRVCNFRAFYFTSLTSAPRPDVCLTNKEGTSVQVSESDFHTLDPPDTTGTRDGTCETGASVVFSTAKPSRAGNQSEKAMLAPQPPGRLILSDSKEDHVAVTPANSVV